MKLLLDEMYPTLIARELRTRGQRRRLGSRVPGPGTSDEQVLDHARSDGRAVLTENVRDFRPLAEALLAAGDSHAGLVFTTEKRWPRVDPGGLINALDALVVSIPKQPVDAELWV